MFPIPEPTTISQRDARKVSLLPRFEGTAPDGAPWVTGIGENAFIDSTTTVGSSGTTRLVVDGRAMDEKHVPATMPFAFSGNGGADTGRDDETPVSDESGARDDAFSG